MFYFYVCIHNVPVLRVVTRTESSTSTPARAHMKNLAKHYKLQTTNLKHNTKPNTRTRLQHHASCTSYSNVRTLITNHYNKGTTKVSVC